jgi:hypothetical protein
METGPNLSPAIGYPSRLLDFVEEIEEGEEGKS